MSYVETRSAEQLVKAFQQSWPNIVQEMDACVKSWIEAIIKKIEEKNNE